MEEIKNGGEEERKEAVISTTYDSVDNLDIKLVLSNSSRIWLPFQSSPLFSLLSSRSFSPFFLFTFSFSPGWAGTRDERRSLVPIGQSWDKKGNRSRKKASREATSGVQERGRKVFILEIGRSGSYPRNPQVAIS